MPWFSEVIDEKKSGISSYDQDMIIWWYVMEDDYVLMGFDKPCYVFVYYVVRFWLLWKMKMMMMMDHCDNDDVLDMCSLDEVSKMMIA